MRFFVQLHLVDMQAGQAVTVLKPEPKKVTYPNMKKFVSAHLVSKATRPVDHLRTKTLDHSGTRLGHHIFPKANGPPTPFAT